MKKLMDDMWVSHTCTLGLHCIYSAKNEVITGLHLHVESECTYLTLFYETI